MSPNNKPARPRLTLTLPPVWPWPEPEEVSPGEFLMAGLKSPTTALSASTGRGVASTSIPCVWGKNSPSKIDDKTWGDLRSIPYRLWLCL